MPQIYPFKCQSETPLPCAGSPLSIREVLLSRFHPNLNTHSPFWRECPKTPLLPCLTVGGEGLKKKDDIFLSCLAKNTASHIHFSCLPSLWVIAKFLQNSILCSSTISCFLLWSRNATFFILNPKETHACISRKIDE